MKRPTVYLDTTFISAYWYDGSNVLAFSQRLLTRDWWDNERDEYALWISAVTLAELRAGKYPRQADACHMAQRLKLLSLNREIRKFSDKLVAAGVIPKSKPNDAMHMAVATVHRIDYLLTWNYAHLANPDAQRRLEFCCRDSGHRAPVMVTAETIPRTKRGESIRRE